MIDTAFVSVDPDLNSRQIDTFHDMIDVLAKTEEWRRWLSQPAIRTASRTWLVRDIMRTKFARTRHGTNLHLAVREVVEADEDGRLADWVEGWIYEWANRTSEILGEVPPPRVKRP